MLSFEVLTPTVNRAVSIAMSNFPAHHDSSDVKQELWVWIMQNSNTVARILEEDDYEKKIMNLLVRAANTFLKTEDAAVYGYDEEDRFYYSVELIKNILEVVFSYEDWQSFALSQDAMPKAKADPSTGGNNLASYADVKSAVENLSEDYYNLILWRYKYHYTFTRIGELTEVSKQAVSERHERALKAVQASLGQMPLSELRRGHSARTEPRGSISGQVRVEQDYEG